VAAHVAHALSVAGVSTQLIATLGSSEEPKRIAALFKELELLGVQATSCGAHAITDALEFIDGKIFFGQMNGLLSLDWQTLNEAVGRESLERFWGSSDLVALVNWTMTPHLTEIWEALASFQRQPKWLLVDLAEPAKRSDQEVRAALDQLHKMPSRVVLSLNERESARVHQVLTGRESDQLPPGKRLEEIQKSLSLEALIYHRRDRAIWVGGDTLELHLEPHPEPKVLTGAGDHFNAGLILGILAGMPPEAVLATAATLARLYVISGEEVSMEKLQKELQQ
jgi:sugar/nucleoside kinase (ribokinase family)